MSAQIIPLHPPEDLDEQLDRLAVRLDEVREQQHRLTREELELERQFVELDLRVRSGHREGEPLSFMGRVRRLERLLEVHHQGLVLLDEECRLREAHEALQRRLYASFAEES